MRPTTRTFSYGDAQAQAAGADERRRVRRGAGRTAGLDDAQPGRGGDWAQGQQGTAIDRLEGVSEWRGDQYVSAGELNITQPVGAQHAAPLHPAAYDLATTRRGRTLANRMAQHVARVLASPLKGVYSTHID